MRWRVLLTIALAVLCAVGCQHDARQRESFERIAKLVERVREADNATKASFLESLATTECVGDAACELQAACLSSYRTHQQALTAIDEAWRLLGGDGDAARIAATKVAEAERGLERARTLTQDCLEREQRLRERLPTP